MVLARPAEVEAAATLALGGPAGQQEGLEAAPYSAAVVPTEGAVGLAAVSLAVSPGSEAPATEEDVAERSAEAARLVAFTAQAERQASAERLEPGAPLAAGPEGLLRANKPCFNTGFTTKILIKSNSPNQPYRNQ